VIVPQEVLEELQSVAEDVHTSEAEFLEYIRSSEFSVAEARRRSGY
jgi:hypothetical protein